MKIFVRPASGINLPHPQGGRIPPEGSVVKDAPLWRRLAKDGDVEISEKLPPRPEKEPKAPPRGGEKSEPLRGSKSEGSK